MLWIHWEAWRFWSMAGVLGAVLLVCLGTDVMQGKIYNRVTYPAMVFALGFHLIAGGPRDLMYAVLGMFVGFVGLFLPFAISRGVGGGDVKLMAAVGGFVGFPVIVWAYLYSLLVGGMMSIAILIWKGRLMGSLHRVFRFFFTYLLPFLETEEIKPENSEKFKFGWAITVGTIVAVVMVRLNRIDLASLIPA